MYFPIYIFTLWISRRATSIYGVCIYYIPLYCNHVCLHTQKCIASNETSGIDIVVQIILLTELTALEDHQDEAMKLKSSAIKTLLAVMESHQDSDIIDRILVKIGSPDQLVRKYVYVCLRFEFVCNMSFLLKFSYTYVLWCTSCNDYIKKHVKYMYCRVLSSITAFDLRSHTLQALQRLQTITNSVIAV